MVYHLPESIDDCPRRREEDDSTKMSEIFKNTLKVDEFKIIKAIRLGKRDNLNSSEKKPRPLLLKMRHSEEKWNILNNAKRIRNSEEAAIKSLWITKDLTPNEREERKKLWIKKKEFQQKQNPINDISKNPKVTREEKKD